MNLALSALIIILFLLPAFSFRIGIAIPVRRKREDSQITHDIINRNVSKALSKLNFTETVFLFSIVPIALHLFSLYLISFAGYHIDYALLLNIFAGKQNVLAGSSNYTFQGELLSFLFYTLAETFLAVLLGWILIWSLGGKRWLLKILMGNNVWFKLFTGLSLNDKQREQLANILVEVLVETKESSVIYSGLLKNYEVVDNTDNLAYIVLVSAFRRDFRKSQVISKDLEGSKVITSSSYDISYGDIISIPGHFFTIKGGDIVNVNITYMKVTNPGAGKILVPIDFK